MFERSRSGSKSISVPFFENETSVLFVEFRSAGWLIVWNSPSQLALVPSMSLWSCENGMLWVSHWFSFDLIFGSYMRWDEQVEDNDCVEFKFTLGGATICQLLLLYCSVWMLFRMYSWSVWLCCFNDLRKKKKNEKIVHKSNIVLNSIVFDSIATKWRLVAWYSFNILCIFNSDSLQSVNRVTRYSDKHRKI